MVFPVSTQHEHSIERTHRDTVVALIRRHYNIITTGHGMGKEATLTK